MTDNASPDTPPQALSEAEPNGAPPASLPNSSAAPNEAAESTAQAVEFTLDDIDQQLASIKALLGDELTGSPEPEQVEAPEPEVPKAGADLTGSASAAEAGHEDIAPPETQEQPEVSPDDFDPLASLDAEVSVKPAAEPVQAAEPVPAEPAHRFPQRCRAALSQVLQGLARFLEVLDKPFKRLGPRPKNIIGYVAIATTAMSAVTWFIGPLLLPH